MEVRSVEAIVQALNAAGVRYLIAGGMAVVAHGYVRLTMDLDLILDLDEHNLRPALTALASLGYRPLAPVPLEQFIDAGIRAEWVRDKQLTVFTLFSTIHVKTEIDLFVEAPLDFARAYARAMSKEVAPGLAAPFVSLDDLLAMKRQAGRTKDLLDIEQLNKLGEKPNG
jgi:hypothetical protein